MCPLSCPLTALPNFKLVAGLVAPAAALPLRIPRPSGPCASTAFLCPTSPLRRPSGLRLSTQTCPHLQVYTSLLAGQVATATVDTVLQANKALRFAKSNSDAGLCFRPLGSPDDLVLVAYSDASFASRADLTSQGGYLITLCHRDALERGIACDYHVLDWRSFKLPRVSRSTLSSESQAAAEATDALYFASLFLRCILDPATSLNSDKAVKLKYPSALVLDAKALFDVVQRDELQVHLGADKRTAIEALCAKERLKEANALDGSALNVSSLTD